MEEEYITPDSSLPEDVDVASADGEEAGSDVAEIKDVLGELLGKNFPDNETALKSVKDTFSYVGKAKQEVTQKVAEQDAGVKETVEALQKQVAESSFYADHPELKPYKELISKYDANPAVAIEMDTFKEVFSKVKAHDELQNSKSVLETNPRIGQTGADKITEARSALKEGNSLVAEDKAVDAVIDAFKL